MRPEEVLRDLLRRLRDPREVTREPDTVVHEAMEVMHDGWRGHANAVCGLAFGPGAGAAP